MPVVKNCILPEDLYHVERDGWARLDGDGQVTMGLTDVGQSRAGRILTVSFRRPVGTVIDRGRVVALIESGKWVGAVRSLFSGTLTEANERLFEHPTLLNEAFYTDGWLVRLRPSDPGERTLWPTGRKPSAGTPTGWRSRTGRPAASTKTSLRS